MTVAVDLPEVRVGTLEELQQRGVMVATAADRPVAVYLHEGRIAAVDNRCPHLGFPLHKGSVKDGILTCHWHEARFDLCSGCTFDLWADDAPAYETDVREGVVYVASRPRQKMDRDYYFRRLVHGLKHSISLIQAKAILGLRRNGVSWVDVIGGVAEFGVAHHDDWQQGMTLLTIAGNLIPHVSDETMYHLVLRASRQVASDCSDAVPHRAREPLDAAEASAERLSRWFCNWIRDRHRDGAERILLTACDRFAPGPEFADLAFRGANERVYAQIGHVFDGMNKAFELLEHVGWEQAGELLPLLTRQTVMARGGEEEAHWHHPIELIEPLRAAERELFERLPESPTAASIANRSSAELQNELLPVLLGEDPLAIVNLLTEKLVDGTPPTQITKCVCYAAASRLARFAMTNEVADWFNPRHTFIFANAVHQAVRRSPSPGVVRGVLHGALSVYMDRFLNIPAARLPKETAVAELPAEATELRNRLLAALDRHADVEEAARIVLRYLRLDHPVNHLFDTLAFATAREDFDFHAMQVLEAGVQQFGEWGNGPEGEQILVGVVRQLAAFCPTPRAAFQTATIALRLDRGDRMYENGNPV